MELQIGWKVMLNPSHEAFNQYWEQHQGDWGTIIKANFTFENNEHWSEIQWQNGNKYIYPNSSIFILDETPREDVRPSGLSVEDMQAHIAIHGVNGVQGRRFAEGANVRMKPGTREYTHYMRQHKGNIGVVNHYKEDDWVYVTWENGETNSYREGWLIPADENIEVNPCGEVPLPSQMETSAIFNVFAKYVTALSPKEQEEKDVSWEDVERLPNDPKKHEKKGDEIVETAIQYPLLPGTRVCANPESDRYKTVNQYAKGNGGYIIDIEKSDIDLKRFKSMSKSNRENIIVNIRFDNGTKYRTYSRDLLPIDGESIDVHKVLLNNGNSFYLIPTILDSVDQLNRLVISQNRRYNDEDTRIFDTTWRNSIYDAIKNS